MPSTQGVPEDSIQRLTTYYRSMKRRVSAHQFSLMRLSEVELLKQDPRVSAEDRAAIEEAWRRAAEPEETSPPSLPT